MNDAVALLGQFVDVLGLVEMEIIFLTAALTVLRCKGVGSGKVLVTHQCLATAEW